MEYNCFYHTGVRCYLAVIMFYVILIKNLYATKRSFVKESINVILDAPRFIDVNRVIYLIFTHNLRYYDNC